MTHSLSRYPAGVAWAHRALVFAVSPGATSRWSLPLITFRNGRWRLFVCLCRQSCTGGLPAASAQ